MENLSAREVLKEYKKSFDVRLTDYFKRKEKQARKIDPLALEVVEIIRDFVLAGGKRLRPSLVYYGYLAAGGENKPAIIDASMSIELVHAFLLIHDDIIDRDLVRHGKRTVHETYRRVASGFRLDEGEAAHFGNSMAIVAGDYAYSMANEILYDSDYDPAIILEALKNIQQIVARTIPGEMVDVLMSAKRSGSEEEIMRMYDGKTAHYTFEGPLLLGCSLAGQEKNTKLLDDFSAYALLVGRAFQIRDDILGVFGDQKKTGKAVGADISEGKQTILVAKVLERGTREEKKSLLRLLGKKNLDSGELEMVCAIIKKTGSLEYAEKLSEKFVLQSLAALEKIEFKNDEARDYLESLAKYIIKREV